jgi:eukaryotic-like serine/threonine-protein kinase
MSDAPESDVRGADSPTAEVTLETGASATVPLAPADRLLSTAVDETATEVASKLRKAQVRAALFHKVAPARIGRFILLERLGVGGMGEIYAAYDDQLDRKVALKLVRSDSGLGRRADERLLREAQVLAQVSHPNVVHIYEAGTHGGKVFIAMELVRGKTLTSWLEDAAQVPHGARERQILRQFIAAGRGLEAAHAGGVTHRDFKPDNVLVGDDGRVRVVDFGLARARADEPAPGEPGRSSRPAETVGGGGAASTVPLALDGPTIDHVLEPVAPSAPPAKPGRARAGEPAPGAPRFKVAARLTETGTLMGTPRFMSPEQMRGEAADPRSDQFSFCVALYRALYGEYPFLGESWQELKASMESGELRAASSLPVPGFLRQALRRGLAVDPAQRFPGMSELLAALEPRSRRRRGRIAAASLGAAFLGAVALAAGAVYLQGRAPEDPCAAAGAAIDASWPADREAALQAMFGRSELPFAGVAWRGLAARLDEYTGRWRGEAIAACRATHVEHTQSAPQLDRRMSCLGRGKRQLAALVAELGAGAAGAVEHAIDAAEALPALEICGEAGSLPLGPEPPPAAVAGRVEEVREQIARAFTLEVLARPEESLVIARDAIAAARGLGYPPVHAEALLQAARALYMRGTAEARGEAERLAVEGLDIAEAQRHDELAAEIWNQRVYMAVSSRKEQAYEWWRRNEAAVRRLGDNAQQQARLRQLRGEIYYFESKYAQAADEYRAAIQEIERAPAHRLELSRYYNGLASSLAQIDKRDEALRMHERAQAIALEALGAGHLDVVLIQSNYGKTLSMDGQRDGARSVLEGALRSMSARDREAHPLAAKIHSFLSDLYYREARLDLASAHGRASLEIHQRARSSDLLITEAVINLANAEFRRRDFRAALALYERALALRRAHTNDSPYHLAANEGAIAETLLRLERHDEAMRHLVAAERLFERGTLDRATQAWILTVRGQILAGQRQLGAAIPVIERALGLFGDGATDLDRARAMWTLARALHELGRDGGRVRSLAEGARAIFAAQGAVVAQDRDAIARFIGRLPKPTR